MKPDYLNPVWLFWEDTECSLPLLWGSLVQASYDQSLYVFELHRHTSHSSSFPDLSEEKFQVVWFNPNFRRPTFGLHISLAFSREKRKHFRWRSSEHPFVPLNFWQGRQRGRTFSFWLGEFYGRLVARVMHRTEGICHEAMSLLTPSIPPDNNPTCKSLTWGTRYWFQNSAHPDRRISRLNNSIYDLLRFWRSKIYKCCVSVTKGMEDGKESWAEILTPLKEAILSSVLVNQ